MRHLTDDMAQLRRNIDGSRKSRLAQQNERGSGVSALLAGFAATRVRNGAQDSRARATFVMGNTNDVNRLLDGFRRTRQMMGRQGHEDRVAFVTNVTKKTRGLLGSFNADRKGMAERGAKERAVFIADMTNSVADMANSVAAFINAVAQDRAGAHAVFFGSAAASKKAEPALPHAAVFEQKKTVTEVNESQEPKRKQRETLGAKKDK